MGHKLIQTRRTSWVDRMEEVVPRTDNQVNQPPTLFTIEADDI